MIAIFISAIREVAARDYGAAQIDAWARVDRETWAVRRLSLPTWIAMIGQTPAGFADLESDGHLDMMFVHPAYQRVGVATALLERVEAAAREQTLTRIFTDASITACAFFQSRGFQIVTQQVVELHGEKLTNFRMEKTIQ